MLYYYMTGAILTMLFLGILLSIYEPNKTSSYILVMMILLAVGNFAYVAIAISSNLPEAVLANKFRYVCSCFLPPTILFFTCEVCDFKARSWLRGLLFGYSFLVFLLIFTSDSNSFFYTSVFLETYRGVTVLSHTNGPGQLFAYSITYGYIAANFILLIYAAVKKRSVSKLKIWSIFGLLLANAVLFFIGQLINPKFEVFTITYVVDSLILLIMYYKGVVYNVEESIVASLNRQDEYGFIMFDENLRYLGSSGSAVMMFPAVAACVPERPVDNVLGMELILDWLQQYRRDHTENFTYEFVSQHLECHIEKVYRGRQFCGYMMELRDDTEKWSYMEQLASRNFELKKIRRELEDQVSEQTEEISRQHRDTAELFIQTLIALSEAVDAKDSYTCGHSRRVAQYAVMIARRMGKPHEYLAQLYYAGLLHDVGKIKVADTIINKQGRLTYDENDLIRIHPIAGYYILKGIPGNSYLAIGAKYHHEWYNGSGYPSGLSGENIPEIARILGVADAYDAMTSNRSYRKALPQDVVREELRQGRGTQFDPAIADIMLQLMEEDPGYTMRQDDPRTKNILVADSDPAVGADIADIIQDDLNCKIISISGKEELLKMLDGEGGDLILLDAELLGDDTIDILRKIRFKHRIPVIMLTDEKQPGVPAHIAALGCEDYLTKPLIPTLVREVLYNMTKDVPADINILSFQPQ